MTIKEALQFAIEGEHYDLQALIMFLVLEKKVLTYDQDIRELDLYVKERNKRRMIPFLKEYKEKMNIEPKPCVFQVFSGDTVYLVKAKTIDELKSLCFLNNISIDHYEIRELDKLHEDNGLIISVRKLRERKGSIIGKYELQI